MRCKKCGFEAPVMSYDENVLEFITAVPSWWIDECMKPEDNSSTPILMCPKCGEVQNA